MAESETERMLRAQREWQEKVASGEVASPGKKGWKWWQVALAVLGGLVALGVISDTIERTTDPAGYAAKKAAREAESKGGERAQPVDQKADSATRKAELTKAVVGLHGAIMAGMKSCDESSKALADVAGRLGDGATVYDGYTAAKRAQDGCRASWSQLAKIEVPDALEGKVKDEAEEAIQTCEMAAAAKQGAAKAMAEVFDGDMRPSALENAREQASAGQSGVMACVAGIFATGIEAGLDPSIFGKAD